MSNIVLRQVGSLAVKLGMDSEDATELLGVLKATAFKGPATDAQLSALLVVANQYGLNPWTKEVYAFPDKNNGIVPIVGVDGWARIINSHPEFDGMEFNRSENMVRMDGARSDSPDWMECVMYRKDRSRPIVIREYLDEVYRAPFKKDNGYQVDGPWQTHTKRFLRHKSMIQCARLAFGFVGIYDEDEAERITERNMGNAEVVSSRPVEVILPDYSDDQLAQNLPAWQKAADEGKFNADNMIAKISTRYALSVAQLAVIRSIKPHVTEVQQADAMADHSEFIAELEGN